MGGIKYAIHPLFFAVGLYYAFTGRIFLFLVYTVTALAHETGHAIAAERVGYKLRKITLTPFGAIASGNIEGLKFYDQFIIAVAGPAVNIATGIVFVALWWVFPEIYAFTDVCAEANFSIALVNLIPVYPLDGGRILFSLLSLKTGANKAFTVCKITGVIFGVLPLIGFFYTLYYAPNVSLFIFSVFVLIGALSVEKENAYVKIGSYFCEENLRRGMPVKVQAVSGKTTLKTLVKITDARAVNEIVVYENGVKIKTLNQKRLDEILLTGKLSAKIEEFL